LRTLFAAAHYCPVLKPRSGQPVESVITSLVLASPPVATEDRFVALIPPIDGDATQKYTVLRRLALVQHFLAGIPLAKGDYPDWDELLSVESLSQRYGVGIKESTVLKPFRFASMPPEFLQFGLPPFDIDFTGPEVSLSLFTGERVVGRAVETRMAVEIQVVGQKMSRVVVRDVFDNLIVMKGLYVDEFGNEDHGLKGGEILRFSETRHDQLMETILSGEWTNGVPQSTEFDVVP
jgi:hypothetical protein